MFDTFIEALQLTANNVILVYNFVRTPDLFVIFSIVQDNKNESIETPLYKRRIKTDKKNRQYFIIDDKKIYIRHKVI